MLAIFITIAACVTFFVEARKRNQSPFKWVAIALVAFWLPSLVLALTFGFILGVMGMPFEEAHNLQVVISISGFVIGFYLLVRARKQLYRSSLTQEYMDQSLSQRELEINENEDGTFSVDGRAFPSRKDAEDYRSLITR
jgi:hypothetical protein